MPNPPIFKGSAQRIEQVVINRVMNACQSLPDRERSIRLRTGQDLDNTGVFIEIQDEEIGMPAEVMQQIKDPFYTTKRDGGGTGLGLAISDRIIRDHEGRLSFYSDFSPGQMLQTGSFYKLWFMYFVGAGAALIIIGGVAGMAKKSMGDMAWVVVALLRKPLP